MSIDWTEITETENIIMRLANVEMETDHDVTFVSVFQTDAGGVGANVVSESIAGNLLWLAGEYGPSNGLNSLIKAAGGDADGIEGGTFTYSRVKSEKSPVGYAHYWRTA